MSRLRAWAKCLSWTTTVMSRHSLDLDGFESAFSPALLLQRGRYLHTYVANGVGIGVSGSTGASGETYQLGITDHRCLIPIRFVSSMYSIYQYSELEQRFFLRIISDSAILLSCGWYVRRDFDSCTRTTRYSLDFMEKF